MRSKEIITDQLKSILIAQFLKLYFILQEKIRKEFNKYLVEVDDEIKNELYFYYGGKLGTYIDYNGSSLKLSNNKYKKNEEFNELSINQIIKLDKTRNFIGSFDFEINSINQKMTILDVHDCMTKLLNMRNLLAHETNNLVFKTKHIIESFSKEKLMNYSEPFLENYDLNIMDDDMKIIFSNYIYMKKIIKILDSKIEEINSSV